MTNLFRQWRLYGNAVVHKDFAQWLWHRFWLDDIPGRAAQLSYYFLLALFPLLICLSAVMGVFFAAEARLEQRLMGYLASVMPRDAFGVVRSTMNDLQQTSGGGTISFGLLMSVWLASSGMEAVIDGLDVAFQVKEPRPWWRGRLVALGLTIVVALLAGCSLGVVLAGGWGGKAITDILGLGMVWQPVWFATPAIASLLFLLFAISLVYLFGPNLGERRQTQVILPGAIVALIGWVAASAGLRLYLDYFSTFGRTYGSLGAVIALLLWLYLIGAILLLGAEINGGIQSGLSEATGRPTPPARKWRPPLASAHHSGHAPRRAP